jgi:hypothetical protein
MGTRSQKGWVYNSDTSDYEFQVYNASGTVKTIFNEDGTLFGNGGTYTVSSASTSGTTSVENIVASTTLTGAGAVGGRSRFQLDTNVALGGWANALKGMTVFGAAGAVTGLGSAICAELTLSAGTAAGTYAPLELELNLAAGALTGTQTSLIYASVNGAAAGTFDDNGVLISLNGVEIGANHIFQASAKSAINATHAMKIKVLGVDYFIPCHTSAAFGV